ncbi:PUA-like domain-containing protein [Zopfochytrium polystomum]|nr:PUA-like domain-containing protein [Zopfochytrium polystomum]
MSTVSPNRPDVVAFMTKASNAMGVALPAPKDVFGFGGSDSRLTDELLEKAIRGEKTATTSWPIPDPMHWGVGDLSVILNGSGEPAAVMRTLSFVKCKFKDVAEDFALAEAEGDYEAYRQGHIAFYGRQKDGRLFNDESWVLCEYFEVIYPRPAR